MLPTNGRVTRDGTKNTGSHLASNAAPGVRRRCSLLSFVPEDGFEANKTAKRTPHPPRDDGNFVAISKC